MFKRTLLVVLALSGCGEVRPLADVEPHSDHFVTRREFVQRFGEPHNSVSGLAPLGSSSLGSVYTTGTAYIGWAVGDRQGVYRRSDDTCWVWCSVPAEPNADAELTMLHEHAHRWDTLHHDIGGSPIWHLLALTSEGRQHLTHHDINTRLRAEGYLP